MEVHQLRLLRELNELGSVTAVAETLYVTPSAVSQQLAQLQRSVGVELTRKQGRSLILTSAGLALAEAGGKVLEAMAQAQAAVSNHHDSPQGTVSLSGFHSAGQVLFGPLLGKLRQESEIQLQLTDEDVAEQNFPALTSKYDVVLAHRMSHTGNWDAHSLSITPLTEEPFDVALAQNHPLANQDQLRPQDLTNCAWVTSRAGYSPDDVLNALAVLSGIQPLVRHRVNDYSTVANIVAQGEVLGLLPRFLASQSLPAGVTLRPLAGVDIRRRIDALCRPENAARRSVRVVLEALQSTILDLLDDGFPKQSEG